MKSNQNHHVATLSEILVIYVVRTNPQFLSPSGACGPEYLSEVRSDDVPPPRLQFECAQWGVGWGSVGV